jgi:hypothetical protein
MRCTGGDALPEHDGGEHVVREARAEIQVPAAYEQHRQLADPACRSGEVRGGAEITATITARRTTGYDGC